MGGPFEYGNQAACVALRPVLIRVRDMGTLVAVYRNPDEKGCFSVGYVVSIGRSDFTLRCVSPGGEEDGATTCFITDVYKVTEESRYLGRIQHLIARRGHVLGESLEAAYEPEVSSCFIEEFKRAKHLKQVVAVVLRRAPEALIAGFVEHVSEGAVQIAEVTHEGEPDGRTTFRTDDILRLDRNDRDGQVLALCYRHRTHVAS